MILGHLQCTVLFLYMFFAAAVVNYAQAEVWLGSLGVIDDSAKKMCVCVCVSEWVGV